jgi:hypothetical protein
MNVIGHDRPRTELVEPSLAFTHDYHLHHQLGDAGLVQPQGTGAISMQDAIRAATNACPAVG